MEAIERLYRTDPEALCAYCLGDARLVLDILASEGFLDTALRKSLLIGTTLDQTWVSVASFEYLYLEHLHRRGMVAPTLGVDQDPMERSPGGGLITPRAGLSDNVLAFDFRSLYPSLIRTFNIDPLSRARTRTPRPPTISSPPPTAPASAASPASCPESSSGSSSSARRRSAAETSAPRTRTRS